MASPDASYDDGYLDGEEDDEGITSEDCWQVISAFFDSKGLVSQQIDSFDDFMINSMPEIVEANSTVTVDHKSPPSSGDDSDPIVLRRYEIKFTRLLLSKPSMTEGDGATDYMLPHEARLRNLTYSASIFVYMTKKVSVARERVAHDNNQDEPQLDEYGVEIEGDKQDNGTYLEWEVEDEPEKDMDGNDIGQRVFIGKLPMMLKAKYCHLRGLKEQDLYNWSECPYDQGGYFIINGSEKVLIAQERSAANIVQVFKKQVPRLLLTWLRFVAPLKRFTTHLESSSKIIQQNRNFQNRSWSDHQVHFTICQSRHTNRDCIPSAWSSVGRRYTQPHLL